MLLEPLVPLAAMIRKKKMELSLKDSKETQIHRPRFMVGCSSEAAGGEAATEAGRGGATEGGGGLVAAAIGDGCTAAGTAALAGGIAGAARAIGLAGGRLWDRSAKLMKLVERNIRFGLWSAFLLCVGDRCRNRFFWSCF